MIRKWITREELEKRGQMAEEPWFRQVEPIEFSEEYLAVLEERAKKAEQEQLPPTKWPEGAEL